jgi:hypothetical protein
MHWLLLRPTAILRRTAALIYHVLLQENIQVTVTAQCSTAQNLLNDPSGSPVGCAPA